MSLNARRAPVVRLGVVAAICVLTAGCGSAPTSGGAASRGAASGGAAAVSGDPAAPGAGLFTVAEPWTADVSGAAVSDRSEAIIAALNNAGGWGSGNELQTDFSITTFEADASSPRLNVVGTDEYCYRGPDCEDVPATMPVPKGASVEGSEDLTCDITGETEGQGDCHLIVVDRKDHMLYETYQTSKQGENLSTGGLFAWKLDKKYPETLRGDQCTSADAAGFPIAALTPTADEVATGELAHAIRFILPNDRMKADVYVRPATHAGGPESADPDAPPYGVRFRLKSDFDDSSYSAGAKTVIAALKKYGMLLSDGGEIALTFADDRNTKAKWADLGIDSQSFSEIPPDEFDVVELGDEIPLTYDCVRNP